MLSSLGGGIWKPRHVANPDDEVAAPAPTPGPGDRARDDGIALTEDMPQVCSVVMQCRYAVSLCSVVVRYLV
jgi:hypothetical protein